MKKYKIQIYIVREGYSMKHWPFIEFSRKAEDEEEALEMAQTWISECYEGNYPTHIEVSEI